MKREELLSIMKIRFLILWYKVIHYFSQHSVIMHKRFAYTRKFLPDDPVILEEGARFGEDTMRMCRIWPRSTIHAFEPLPNNAKMLERNTKHLGNVHFFPLALSNRNDKSIFYVNIANPGASSLYKPALRTSEYARVPINIECISIADWAKNNHVDHIDFMWLDIEGHELAVLKATPEDLLTTVKVIYVEVLLEPRWEGVPLYPELCKWMEQQGFKIIKKYRDGWRYMNVLFVRPDL